MPELVDRRSGDEITPPENRDAYDRIAIGPRPFEDFRTVDASMTLWGRSTPCRSCRRPWALAGANSVDRIDGALVTMPARRVSAARIN
jgi:hypothetical protein